MKRKSTWMLAVALGASVVSLVGCGSSQSTSNSGNNSTGGSGSSSSPVTITFYESMGGDLGKVLTSMTNEFEKQYPNIKVQFVYSGSYTTLQQKITAAVAAGQPPTMAQVQEPWETEYYQNGALVPLQNLLPASTINDLIPIWKQDNSYDGKLISAPFNKSDYVLYYNTTLFGKAGIKTPPTTWNQLLQDAQTITQKTGTPGFGFQPNYYTFDMFLHQAGGTTLTADEKQAAFNNASGLNALKFMQNLVKSKAGTIVSANSYLSDGFNSGNYAMDLDTVAALTYITHAKFKIAPLPADVQQAVPTTGTNLVVFSKASTDEQKAAATYINWLISDKNTINWAEKTGYLPVTESALTSSAWKTFAQSHPNEAVGPSELPNGYFDVRLASMSSASTEITTFIGDFLNGQGTAQSTLTQCVNEVNKAVNSSN